MVRVEHGALGTGRRILVARVVDILVFLMYMTSNCMYIPQRPKWFHDEAWDSQAPTLYTSFCISVKISAGRHCSARLLVVADKHFRISEKSVTKHCNHVSNSNFHYY